MDYLRSITHVIASCLVLHDFCKMNDNRCRPEWVDHDSLTKSDKTSPTDVTRYATTSANVMHSKSMCKSVLVTHYY